MKVVRIVDDVRLHVIEIDADFRHVAVFLLEIGDERADGIVSDLAVKCFDPFAVFLAHLRHAFDVRMQLLAELPDRLLDLLALFLRQLLKLFLVNDLAVADGRQDITGRRFEDADVFTTGTFLEVLPLLVEFLVRRRLDGLQLRTVVERRRDREPQLLDQLPHVVAKRLAESRRELERPRPLRI